MTQGLQEFSFAGLRTEYSVEAGRASSEEWTRILGNFGDANLYQTWAYSAARWGERRLGHLVVRREGRVVAAAQVILMKVPFLPGGLAYVKWGPLWQERDALRMLLIALRKIYANRFRMLVRVTPWGFEDDARGMLMHDSGFELNQGAERLRTAVLDLSYSMDDLRASLTRHWRANLKMAEKNNLEINEGTTRDLMEEFVKIYGDMRRRKGTEAIPALDYFPRVQLELSEHLKMRIAICRRDGIAIAGLVVSAIGSSAFAVAAATATTGMDSRGSYLLQWRMIQWLKDRNIHCYDLARINEKTHPGTTQFKLGLSGKLGSILEYLGEFQASDSKANHMLLDAVEWARAYGAALKNSIQRQIWSWKEAI